VDAAPQVDEAQTARFVAALFRYADEGTWVSLRGFRNKNLKDALVQKQTVQINGDGFAAIVAKAGSVARWCLAQGNGEAGYVFCPPIATFTNRDKADTDSLANGLALCVECDARPNEARARLENLLGRATVVVASGGLWTDPLTGEWSEKLHIHWRLKEPARTPADLETLRATRELMTRLVNSDPTAIFTGHPLRWPGSVHTKEEPRACRIVALLDAAEVELGDAFALVSEACEASGIHPGANGKDHAPGEAQADPRDIADAMAQIPNDGDWNAWSTWGMTIHRATGGAGFDIFDTWSRRNLKYDAGNTAERWEHWHKHPATKRGAGSIIYHATIANPAWVRPSHRFGFINDPPKEEARRARIEPKPLGLIDPAKIPPRPWLFGEWLLRRYVTVVIAPPGAGKTTFSAHIAIAVAIRRAWAGRTPFSDGKVWLFNNEDEIDELYRHICASAIAMGVPQASLADRIFCNSGADEALLVATKGKNGTVLQMPDVELCVEYIKRCGIKLFIVDPFAETHGVEENDNGAIKQVVAMYRRIAQLADCAVLLIHHTSKPPSGAADSFIGNMYAGRGASSFVGIVRVAMTLFGMTEADAVALGLNDIKDRINFVRLDRAKANLSKATAETTWFEWQSVDLENGNGLDASDSVGVFAHKDFSGNIAAAEERRKADAATLMEEVGGRINTGTCKSMNAIAKEIGDTSIFGVTRTVRIQLDKIPFAPGAVRLADGTALYRRRTGTEKTATIELVHGINP